MSRLKLRKKDPTRAPKRVFTVVESTPALPRAQRRRLTPAKQRADLSRLLLRIVGQHCRVQPQPQELIGALKELAFRVEARTVRTFADLEGEIDRLLEPLSTTPTPSNSVRRFVTQSRHFFSGARGEASALCALTYCPLCDALCASEQTVATHVTSGCPPPRSSQSQSQSQSQSAASQSQSQQSPARSPARRRRAVASASSAALAVAPVPTSAVAAAAHAAAAETVPARAVAAAAVDDPFVIGETQEYDLDACFNGADEDGGVNRAVVAGRRRVRVAESASESESEAEGIFVFIGQYD
jgi:hypothetical protein